MRGGERNITLPHNCLFVCPYILTIDGFDHLFMSQSLKCGLDLYLIIPATLDVYQGGYNFRLPVHSFAYLFVHTFVCLTFPSMDT